MTLGDLVRDARIRHGLSQRRLAGRSGIDQATISRVESGKVAPSVELVDAILLGVGERVEMRATPLRQPYDPDLVEAALRRSPEERFERMAAFARFADAARAAGRKAGLS